MSLVALVTDIHLGARNDLPSILQNHKKFFDHIFFPKLKELGIKEIINLGDTFDRRKYVNYNTLNESRDFLFEPLRDFNSHFILGNHDSYFNNTIDVNSARLLLEDYKEINIIDKPINHYIHGSNGFLSVALMPWICKDNFHDSMKFIEDTQSTVCMGHFPIKDFIMHQGFVCEDGFDRNMFDKFKMTMSGHFHFKSTDGNIFYLGSPFELTWSDYDTLKGFHIFNTETLDMEFIPNPYKLFFKIDYDDSVNDYDMEDDYSQYSGTYVKVIIKKKNSSKTYEMFLKNLYDCNPQDVKIIEELHTKEDNFKIESIINQSNNTLEMLNSYIDNSNFTDVDSALLKVKMSDIYLKALQVREEHIEDNIS